jgi:hypothetical protein
VRDAVLCGIGPVPEQAAKTPATRTTASLRQRSIGQPSRREAAARSMLLGIGDNPRMSRSLPSRPPESAARGEHPEQTARIDWGPCPREGPGDGVVPYSHPPARDWSPNWTQQSGSATSSRPRVWRTSPGGSRRGQLLTLVHPLYRCRLNMTIPRCFRSEVPARTWRLEPTCKP